MNLRYILMHAWLFGVHSVKTNWPYVVSNLLFPLSLLFVVGIISHGVLLPFALAGGLVALLASDGAGNAVELVGLRVHHKYQDLIVATKTGPFDYMFGETFSGLFWALPSVLLYLALDVYFKLITPFSLVMTAVTAILVLVSVSSISFMIASFISSTRVIWPTMSMVSILMTVLAPTFYPYTYLPHSILLVLSILPTTPAAVLEQGYFGIAPMQWYMLGILIIETIGYFLIARHLTRWREG